MSALLCLTNNVHCCNSLSGESGHWFLPNGSIITNDSEVFHTSAGLYFNALLRTLSIVISSSGTMGMFLCTIPDIDNDYQNIYIGVYPDGIGKYYESLMPYETVFSNRSSVH